MRVILVEDDFLQAEWILGELTSAFKGADATRIATASAFLAEIAALEQHPPSVIVVDEMLRWADPPSIEDIERGLTEPPPPPDWRASRAGIELIRTIQGTEALQTVPTILYTVLERHDLDELDLPADVQYVTKNTDSSALITAVRLAVRPQR